MAIAILLFANSTNAQVRQDLVNDFTTAQQDTLVKLMQEYIDSKIIQYHCDFQTQTLNPNLDIHSDFDFLPFHRVYLEGLEDFLYLKGHEEFVPLPAWDPDTSAPTPFHVIDVDCKNTLQCIYNGINYDTSFCVLPNDWDPQISRPSILTGANLCSISFSPTSHTAGSSCCPNGLSRIIEGAFISNNYHNSVHNDMSGVMSTFRSPSTPIFWPWHGYVDDIWKEWECNCSQSTTQSVDLYMKDNHETMRSWRDRGEEPSFGPTYTIFQSEDIWVRNQPGGDTTDVHQNPEYHSTNPVYVYVRVRNRGCDTSLGSEKLVLHWQKAFLAGQNAWPGGWTGATSNPTLGDVVDTLTIPPIPPGGQTILEFEWPLIHPDSFPGSTDPWHFCLLARVVATNDPMAVIEGPSVPNNTINNNNIVWKNVTMVDSNSINNISPGGIVGVGSPFNIDAGEETNVFLEFNSDENYPSVHEVAEVYAVMSENLFAVWEQGGFSGEGIDIIDEEEGRIRILTDGARIENLVFEASEWGTMMMEFNMLVDEYEGEDEFKYYVSQVAESGDFSGGELYHLRMGEDLRVYDAEALASNQTISRTDTATLSAVSIGEPAIYQWYNSVGKLIDTGQIIKITPKKSDKYKLRTVAKSDGFVDYDSVNVDVVFNAIKNIAPNPASNQVAITYDAKNAKTAELRIQAAFGSFHYNYSVDINKNSILINISNYQTGIYSVMLIHDGLIVDTKQLSVF